MKESIKTGTIVLLCHIMPKNCIKGNKPCGCHAAAEIIYIYYIYTRLVAFKLSLVSDGVIIPKAEAVMVVLDKGCHQCNQGVFDGCGPEL